MSFAFAHVVLTPATAPLLAPVPVYRGLDMDTAVDKTCHPRNVEIRSTAVLLYDSSARGILRRAAVGRRARARLGAVGACTQGADPRPGSGAERRVGPGRSAAPAGGPTGPERSCRTCLRVHAVERASCLL